RKNLKGTIFPCFCLFILLCTLLHALSILTDNSGLSFSVSIITDCMAANSSSLALSSCLHSFSICLSSALASLQSTLAMMVSIFSNLLSISIHLQNCSKNNNQE